MKLLKAGLPWEFLMEISEAQLYMILGVQSAVEQKESEDNEAQSQHMQLPKLGRF